MRLGLMGPMGSGSQLRLAIGFLLDKVGAERVIYLGEPNDGFSGELERWATELVWGAPSERGLVSRAAALGAGATAAELEELVLRERAAMRLGVVEVLPEPPSRAVEVCDGKIAILVHDKSCLVESDLLPASLLVFGKSKEPVARQVGPRWFLSPGPLESGGVALLQRVDEGSLEWVRHDAAGRELERVQLQSRAASRVRVHGD